MGLGGSILYILILICAPDGSPLGPYMLTRFAASQTELYCIFGRDYIRIWRERDISTLRSPEICHSSGARKVGSQVRVEMR